MPLYDTILYLIPCDLIRVVSSSTFDKCILTLASTNKFNPPPTLNLPFGSANRSPLMQLQETQSLFY